jgi:hypothetical protein
MDAKIDEFFNSIKDGSFALIRGELVTFVDGLKNRTDDFSKQQHVKIEKYLLQLATQQITKQQFQDAMLDIKTLAEMELRLENVQRKAAAQRITDGLTKLVINGLIKAIPT